MRINRFALAAMLLAAVLSGSGCVVIGVGTPALVGTRASAPAPRAAAERGAAWRSSVREAGPLTAEELHDLGRLEASAGLEDFEGGYYYAPSYYASPAEDFLFALFAIAATIGLVAFLANNADEAHIHTDNVDIIIGGP